MIQSAARRFLKGFIAGAVSGALVVVQQGVVISSLDDAKKFLVAVIIGAVSGVLLALEKMISWKE